MQAYPTLVDDAMPVTRAESQARRPVEYDVDNRAGGMAVSVEFLPMPLYCMNHLTHGIGMGIASAEGLLRGKGNTAGNQVAPRAYLTRTGRDRVDHAHATWCDLSVS